MITNEAIIEVSINSNKFHIIQTLFFDHNAAKLEMNKIRSQNVICIWKLNNILFYNSWA